MDNKNTVVVIDDMRTICEHTKQILKDDFKVIPCLTGHQALNILHKANPDIILVDVNMPDMDGFEVLQSIKSDESFAKIPVILMTTELDSETEIKGFEMGADDFITKPFTAASLFKRISLHLKSK